MRSLTLFGITLTIFLLTLTVHAQSKKLSAAQISVFRIVEQRWSDWKNDDLEDYLAKHAPNWRRWSLRENKIDTKDDVRSFWQRAKSFEKTTSFELQPIDIQIYGNGRFAAVHYIALESVEFIKDRPTRSGEKVLKGTRSDLKLRFSDFLVLDKGHWLLVGSYRDGSCAISPEFGRECSEPTEPSPAR